MPEITDQELETARRAVQLIQGLYTNPEARQHLDRGLKTLDPNYRSVDDEAARLTKPFEERIDKLEQMIAEREEAERAAAAERAEREAQQRLDDGFGRLRQAGVTDEGLEKIKALMQERTIPDPEAAFALWQRQNPEPPKPEESAYKPQGWDFEGDLMPDAKDWFTNPDAAEDRAIGQILMEERKRGEG